METISQLDTSLLLFLNDWGNDFVDTFFNVLSHKLAAIPLYAFMLYVLYRQLDTRTLIITLVFIALLIVISDQLANVFKNNVQRLRPFRVPALEGLLSKVGKSNGTYGFYSAHASNAIALAVFMWSFLKKYAVRLAWLVVFWALVVAYSRVYLGVHYPGDVLMGLLMGTLVARLIYAIYEEVLKRITDNKTA